MTHFRNIATAETANGRKTVCLRERLGIGGACRFYVAVNAVPTTDCFCDLADAAFEFTKQCMSEPAPATGRPGDMAAIFAEESGLDYETALVMCNMD